MRKIFVFILILSLFLGGCSTRYASKEQLRELRAREKAVVSLKVRIKKAQRKKAALKAQIKALHLRIEKLEGEINFLKSRLSD